MALLRHLSYYALLCLYTGSAEASEAGFLAVLIIALLIDAVAYACYLFFLRQRGEYGQALVRLHPRLCPRKLR